jgi:hypothetical protein
MPHKSLILNKVVVRVLVQNMYKPLYAHTPPSRKGGCVHRWHFDFKQNIRRARRIQTNKPTNIYPY